MSDIYIVDHTPGGTPVYSCACGKQWLAALNAKGRELGIVKNKFDVLQGGYRNSQTAASASTHNGGGCFDLAQYDDKTVLLVRNMGGAGFPRTVAQGFSGPHCHIELDGCPHHPGNEGDYQVTAYRAGYNGLGDGYKARDTAPRPSVFRTWSQGIAWSNISDEGDLELSDSQFNQIMALLKANQSQTHGDIGATQTKVDAVNKLLQTTKDQVHHDIGTTQVKIDSTPAKTVNSILAVKFGDAANTLGKFLGDVRNKFYGSK